MTRKSILQIDKITFVNLDDEGKPTPHGKTKIEFVSDRFKGIEGELPA
jgi:acyl-CoA thioesterase YciA